MTDYSPKAVDEAVAASNRAGRKISGREAKTIHSLLRGRTASTPKGFWTYQAETPPTVDQLPPGAFNGTQAEFEQLSPGMRREIARTAAKMSK